MCTIFGQAIYIGQQRYREVSLSFSYCVLEFIISYLFLLRLLSTIAVLVTSRSRPRSIPPELGLGVLPHTPQFVELQH
jgi:hypothetical protein